MLDREPLTNTLILKKKYTDNVGLQVFVVFMKEIKLLKTN